MSKKEMSEFYDSMDATRHAGKNIIVIIFHH